MSNDEWKDFISLRPYRETDARFIENHWALGLYHGSDWFRAIPQTLFETTYRSVIRKLLSDPGRWVVVASLIEDPDVIVGFSVGRLNQNEPQTLHYVFVKPAWRGKGIGRSLVPDDVVQFTHLTKIGRAIQKKNPNVIFNPFIL